MCRRLNTTSPWYKREYVFASRSIAIKMFICLQHALLRLLLCCCCICSIHGSIQFLHLKSSQKSFEPIEWVHSNAFKRGQKGRAKHPIVFEIRSPNKLCNSNVQWMKSQFMFQERIRINKIFAFLVGRCCCLLACLYKRWI